MAEQTQTEKLKGEIAKALRFYGKKCLKYQELCDETIDADQVLQACREAGLKFVFRNWDGRHTNDLDIEEIKI